jgi:hypothetical protein
MARLALLASLSAKAARQDVARFCWFVTSNAAAFTDGSEWTVDHSEKAHFVRVNVSKGSDIGLYR